VVEAGVFEHPCEGEAVCKLTNTMIPYFNAPIFLENKTQVGKVEEVFGPINSVYFTIKMSEGVVATSYSSGDKFFIDPPEVAAVGALSAPAEGGEAGRRRWPRGAWGWSGRSRRGQGRVFAWWSWRVWGEVGRSRRVWWRRSRRVWWRPWWRGWVPGRGLQGARALLRAGGGRNLRARSKVEGTDAFTWIRI
jgi:rRNA processing protein Gar1